MPYVAPEPKDIKARFPEFEDVPDSAIAFAIEHAMLSVDDSWLVSDYAAAIAFLTAHLLATGGALSDDPASFAMQGPVVSESLGDASWSFASKASQVGLTGLAAELAATWYGQRFLALRVSNHPAVLLC